MSYKSRRNKQKTTTPLLLAGAGFSILVLAAFLFVRQSPQPTVATKTPEALHSGEDTFPEISRVSLADSLTAWENGEAVFVDVRDASGYADNHIPGALSIPLAELEGRLGELDRSKWIITYCT